MTTFTLTAGAPPRDRLELTGLAALLGFVATLQFSIAAAEALLALALLCWAVSTVRHRERIQVPPMFWPLAAYAGATLLAAAFSLEPRVSLLGCKQLVLFLVVPLIYQLARGKRAATFVHVIITVGALSATVGIIEYGILNYDYLGMRPRGTLGHYMTYSGLLMMVTSVAAARLLFDRKDRIWPALVMPALVVALVLTFTRSAWVGTCAAVGLLLTLRNVRLLWILPLVAAALFAVAPTRISERFYSMFDLQDPTNRDRVAMLQAGVEMVRDRPLTGMGPNVVQHVYPQYRRPDAVEKRQPHLHNVPMQIAAERGVIGLAVWIWFVTALTVQLARKFRAGPKRFLPAAGLAVVAAMLGAGMFEYNFGDSEFLMLFLVLVTLPYAAERTDAGADPHA